MLRSPIMWIAVVLVLAVVVWAATTELRWQLGIPVVAFLVVFTMHLHTRVEGAQLRVGVFPIWRRRQEVHAVRSARKIPYQWTKYGGWGIRLGDGAVAYSCWEKQAVRLELDGRDLVIGTGRPDELLAALEAQGVTVQSDRS